MNLSPEIVQARISVAVRQSVSRNAQFDEYLRLMTNDWTEKTQMKLAPNIVHSTVRQMVATTLYETPEYFAQPLQIRYSEGSKGLAAYMNYLWDQIKGDEQTELVITDAIVYPFGVWKLGMGRFYQSEKMRAKLRSEEEKAEEENRLVAMLQEPPQISREDRHATHIPIHEGYLESLPPDSLERQLLTEHIDEHGEYLITPDTTRSPDQESEDPDMPFLYRTSPRDVFFGGGGMIFEETRYALVRHRRNFDEWMEDDSYDHPPDILPKDVSDDVRLEYNAEEEEEAKISLGMGVVDVWEHYDKLTGTFSAWIDGYKEPVKKTQPMPYRFLKGYPIELLRFQVLPEYLYGPSLLAYLDHPQKMDSDMAHRIGTHVKNASIKHVLLTDRLRNPENVEKIKADIQNPEMDAVIEATDPTVLTSLPPPMIDPAFYQLRGIMKEAVQEAVGLNDPARGQISGATATEVRVASASTQIVLTDTSKKVKRGLISCMTKLLAIVREHGPEHMVVPLLKSKDEWAEFKRSDLVGTWRIKIGLPLPGDKQNDLNNAINALHEMRPSPNLQGNGLRRLEGVVLQRLGFEPELYLEESPLADTQKAVELEHKSLMMGQMVLPSPGEDTKYHLEQHESLLSERERSLMTLMQIRDPNVAALAQQQMQAIQQQMQIIQQHVDMTNQMQPGVPQGRRRNALLFPTGNPGTAESVQQNEIGPSGQPRMGPDNPAMGGMTQGMMGR